MSKEAMKLALEALESVGSFNPEIWGEVDRAKAALREALAEQPAFRVVDCHATGVCVQSGLRAEQPAQQEPVALKWQQAPVKTQWGDGMVVASIAIDKDHTLSLYCERDQTLKVEAMFAQRTWVGLTDEDYRELHLEMGPTYFYQDYGRAIEAKLRSKNEDRI